jgi:hypothetical protein
MVFQKGNKPTSHGRAPVHFERVRRRIVEVKCQECTFHRRVDTAFFPEVRPELVLESGRNHMYATRHQVTVQDVRIEAWTPNPDAPKR